MVGVARLQEFVLGIVLCLSPVAQSSAQSSHLSDFVWRTKFFLVRRVPAASPVFLLGAPGVFVTSILLLSIVWWVLFFLGFLRLASACLCLRRTATDVSSSSAFGGPA